CTSFKEANEFVTGGGTGFRVTFKTDGTEIVDYSKMKPIEAGKDRFTYTGSASAKISTKDGAAKIEKIEQSDVVAFMEAAGQKYNWPGRLPNLGPAGLGGTKSNMSYTCAEDSLEYGTSGGPDGASRAANWKVKLTRMKSEEKK